MINLGLILRARGSVSDQVGDMSKSAFLMTSTFAKQIWVGSSLVERFSDDNQRLTYKIIFIMGC
jgi:hypothetical protein